MRWTGKREQIKIMKSKNNKKKNTKMIKVNKLKKK